MTEMYERNIVEIKNEYTSFLTNIMTPLIYEGIKKIYEKAYNVEQEIQATIKNNPDADIKNPGIFKIFQHFLKGIKNLNNHKIEAETNRIREASKCSEYFDILVRAVVKSYIILLTFDIGKNKRYNFNNRQISNERYHESIDVKSFVHKTYIESARMFYNYPELFWNGYKTIEIQRNQREAHTIIRTAIIEAIRKLLPMKLILEEYLQDEYLNDMDDNIEDSVPQSSYHNMKAMLQREREYELGLNNVSQILESDESVENDENDHDSNSDRSDHSQTHSHSEDSRSLDRASSENYAIRIDEEMNGGIFAKKDMSQNTHEESKHQDDISAIPEKPVQLAANEITNSKPDNKNELPPLPPGVKYITSPKPPIKGGKKKLIIDELKAYKTMVKGKKNTNDDHNSDIEINYKLK